MNFMHLMITVLSRVSRSEEGGLLNLPTSVHLFINPYAALAPKYWVMRQYGIEDFDKSFAKAMLSRLRTYIYTGCLTFWDLR